MSRGSVVVLGHMLRVANAKPPTIRARIDALLGFTFSPAYGDLRL